ncbi:hypothetical protein TIFTF001_011934 [Ficus carica]|uniref:Uncharacterized protein n=1 Tax=Ficus carica TaxID=3494 RepID=A0AA87ZSN0_FICCA|nr:hypothetical protein TIFTF001_011934 [Ficus carica]
MKLYLVFVRIIQRPYSICRLKKITDKKDATPGCDVGEPSGTRGGDNISDFENPVAPSAISEVHSDREVNADLLSQPLLSSDWCFPEEDVLYLSDLFDDDQQINCVMDENQPEPDNYLPHKGPYVTCHFEDKTNEMAGTPSCDKGEPSGPAYMISATENPVAPAAILEAHVHKEVNADLLSQPFLLPGDYFTEDDVLYFSDVFDDDQNINWVVDEFHPELENSLPHQGPSVISRLVYKTDEKAGIPGCYVGEPSGNITSDIGNLVAPTAIQEVQSLAEMNSEKDNGMIFSNSFNDGKNIMQVQCGADEPEESSAEFVDGLIVDPHENNCGETTNNLLSNYIQLKSLKRPYFLDGPASVDRNVEGVDGRVKRSRSLALGE